MEREATKSQLLNDICTFKIICKHVSKESRGIERERERAEAKGFINGGLIRAIGKFLKRNTYKFREMQEIFI